MPNEGKTTISSNYAMSEAVTGKKVILVNCDIRRFRPFSGLKMEITHGIESVLLGKKKIDEVVIKGFEENLDILPSKHLKGDITELFLGYRIKELLEELRKRYDLVVLDTPPLTIATDAAILSEYADGIVYVCGYNMVKKEKMLRTKKILQRAGAKIYGVVINKIDEKTYVNEYGYDEYKYYNNYIKK
ncbi:CpsD/CapB family tyrosine-protein kinase [Fusobacteria bacterium ZRK30]|nr:CpsD/CapB family tyrosine-protein kinase [Fusobacteria bacterium ZRK30]